MKASNTLLFRLLLIVGIIFPTNFTNAQPPVFTDSLAINQSFASDTTIYPFNGQQLYGIAASGIVQFNSYSSWIRILISDTNNNQFMVYETNPMLDTAWNFTFETKCEESCFLNSFIAVSISFHINDASLTLGNVEYTQASVDGADAKQYQAKLTVDNDKISRMNAFLESKNMLWRAGETNFSTMYFNDRTDEDEGLAKYPFGFEFYKGGIFQIYDAINEFNEPTYNIVERFDWRSRHDANIENTPYYDGDPDGSGWMTDIRCQKGCWFPITEEWECILDDYVCINAGGIPRESGGCKGFSAIAVTEGFANLYYNQHVNFDLSEQQMISAPLSPPYDNCGDILNGGGGNGFSLIRDFGIIDELCFPFEGINIPCDQQCTTPNDVVFIGDYNNTDGSLFDAEGLKKHVIANGPSATWGIPPLGGNHAIALVGFDVVTLGDYFMIGSNTIVEIGPYDPQIGTPYWIFKNSYGLEAGENGYYYIEVSDNPSAVFNIDLTQEIPISSTLYGQEDVQILDEDLDGYLNWGIGDCPSCPGERDGDDNNASLGPLDENGFCRIINEYTTSFEGASYDYWKQDGDDDFDWILHSGTSTLPNTSPPSGAWDGDRYMIIDGYEMDPPQGATSFFESPLIDLSDECLVLINFHYFRRYANGTACTLTLQLSWDEGQTWSSVWTASNGDNDIDWHEVSLELPASLNKIRFAGTMGSAATQQNMGFDLITITPLEQTGPLVIEGEVPWGGEIHACDDIIIEPESKLILTPGCILYMPEGKKIIVKRKATLFVDGATITNDGEGLWKGIEVWGNNLEINTIYYQGYVNVYNGSTVENAECAFLATRIIEATGEGQPEYAGGIVFVTNSSLINNKKAAWFLPYSGDDDSFSKFTDCLIEVNDNIIAGTTVEEYFELNSIDGVSFTNVTMIDVRSNVGFLSRPTGILSINSYFGVYGSYESGAYTTTFSNLCYGIKALGIQTTDYFRATKSGFYNNLRGIYTSATTGSQIDFCYFQPWENASIWVENYGIYLDECTGYVVEENLFENNSPTAVYGNGLVINNSGTDENQIYRNTFVGLDYGIIAQNKNRHSNGLTGLCLKCNDFDNCNNDIAITTAIGIEDPELGIAASQGASSADPEDMAGNLFYIEGSRPDRDFDDINNEANHITYYYPENNENSRVKPVDYTENTVNLEDVLVDPDWTFEDGCPSNFGGGGGGGGGDGEGPEELLAKMAEYGQKADSVETVLNVLVDAGNTEELQEDVYYSTPPETMEVYTEMMDASPYVSDTVVSTAIEKEDVLPGAMVRDIMVANPHTAKSDQLMEQLDQRWDPLPDYMKAQILQGRSIVSLKEEAESKLANWKLKKARVFNGLVNIYQSDTIDPEASTAGLVSLLEAENSLQAKYLLAFTHLKHGAGLAGEDVLNSIPSQFTLLEGQLAAHQNMVDYYALLSESQNNSLCILQADSILVEDVWDLLETSPGMAAVYARNVLLFLGETSYTEEVIMPDMYKSADALEAYRKLLETEPPQYIRAKPNPAKDYVVLEYMLEQDGNISIEVNNLKGILAYRHEASVRQDEITIDTRSWKPGLYVLSLIQDGKLIESSKFTLID